MILLASGIMSWAQQGGIRPFVQDHVQKSSIDLCLGRVYTRLATGREHAFCDHVLLEPGEMILVPTLEYLNLPENIAGTIYLKHSLAIKGLDHSASRWIHPGSQGHQTLELYTHRPIMLKPAQRVVQLVLYNCR